MLTGTVAATLAGLVFVAISFAIGAKFERTEGDLNAWVAPALIYFGEVFVASAATVAPLSPAVFAGVLLGALAIGVPFGAWRLRYLVKQHREEAIDASTWASQLLFPTLSHVAIGAGAILVVTGDARGMLAIAGGAIVLIACAVRNAWELVVYLLEQR